MSSIEETAKYIFMEVFIMSIKMIVNRICPLCGEHVAEYSVDNDSEWLLTKRSLKQYFHRSCYDKIIEHQKE